MAIYVDNVLATSVAKAASLNEPVAMTSGGHYLVLQAWDAAGSVYQKGLTIYVQ